MQIALINKLNIARAYVHPGWFEELPPLNRFPACLEPEPSRDWKECAAPCRNESELAQEVTESRRRSGSVKMNNVIKPPQQGDVTNVCFL